METERLILRQFNYRDIDDFYEYAKTSKVGPMAGWKPHRNKLETTMIIRHFVNNDNIWTIYHKEDEKAIGSIGLYKDSRRDLDIREGRSIGYALSEEYWGQGIVAEGIREIIRYAFEDLYLDLISAYHYDYNIQSKRVLEKLGFTFEGNMRMGSKDYEGRIHDLYSYSLKREEFLDI